MTRWGRRALALLLALCCGLWALPAAAQALDVGGPEPSLEPGALLALLADGQRGLSPLQALRQPGWLDATPRRLSPGLDNPGPLWLRLRLVNRGRETVTRWVVVGSPRLDDVQAYEVSADAAAVRQQWVGGTNRPLGQRPVVGIRNIFPVTLAPAQEVVFLARVHSRALLQADLRVWDPLSFREDEAQESLLMLAPQCVLLAMVGYLVMLAVAQRERLFGLLALWVLIMALYQLTHYGYVYRYLLPQGSEAMPRLRLLLGDLDVAYTLACLYWVLEFRRLPHWRRGFGVALGLLAAFGVVASWSEVLLASQAAAVLIGLAYLFALAAMGAAWRHRLPRLRYALLPFAIWWVGVVLRLLQVLGLFPLPLGGNDASLWVSASNVAVAMLVAVGHYHGAVRAKLAAQSEQLRLRLEEQARLEHAVDERTHALQQALIAAKDASEAKSDFLARVSHDLRTPLTAIIGYAGLVSGAGRPDAEHGRIILRSAQHLLALLNDLIDYARGGVQPDALQMAPLYTASLVEGLAADGRALAARQHNRFELRVHGVLPPTVEADAKRLRQVLQNLLANAAKFTHGGDIVFAVKVAPALDGAGRRWVRFTVRDSGPGIDAQVLPHLFEPFQRTRAADRPDGLGLGLAIARQWVERMGGRIAAESRPGQGTAMRVDVPLLPVSEDAIASPQRTLAQERLPELDGGARLLWVVEDSAAIREMLCAELQSLGFEVLGLADGAQAVARLRQPDEPPPALVLTDLHMPGVDGHGVLRAVRERWPALPVVMLSAALESQLRGAEAFSAVLGKPVSRAQLRTTLAGLLGLPLDAAVDEPAPAAPLQPPAPEYVAEFSRLARLGAVSDVADWAGELAAQHAPWRGFLEQLRALAEQGDLKGCERLLAQAAGGTASAAAPA